jgi:DNA-binding MarR family transcriptional regulator
VSRLPPPALIGALLRVPSQAIHRRLIAELNAAGFRDLRLPHIAVFSYPSPDGARPGDLAERAGMSKQAMNQLLQSLEHLGYLRRIADEADARARIVRLTRRGQAVWDEEFRVLEQIEQEWRATLGEKSFEQLKRLLQKAWASDAVP